MPEFIFVIFWPTIALPNLIRALHDFTFGRLFHAISPFENISPFKKNGPAPGLRQEARSRTSSLL
jgi:hypothetical protein